MKVILVILTLCLFVSCKTEHKPSRIYYLNSYHAGYASSDATENLVRERLDRKELTLKVNYLNGKYTRGDSLKSAKAKVIYEDMMSFEPDIILVSDDDAIKYVIEPFFNQAGIPVLFCGVNWSIDHYDLNPDYIRGIVEVLPLSDCLDTIRNYYSEMKKLGILSENSISEHSNKLLLDSLYRHRNLTPSYALVDSFSQWKDAFRYMNENVDVIYLPTNGGILNWDDQEAQDFIADEIRVPIITCERFMMPYAVFGMTRVLQEQGEWLTAAAEKIISGADIRSIENTKNNRVQIFVNNDLANAVQFNPSGELMNSKY